MNQRKQKIAGWAIWGGNVGILAGLMSGHSVAWYGVLKHVGPYACFASAVGFALAYIFSLPQDSKRWPDGQALLLSSEYKSFGGSAVVRARHSCRGSVLDQDHSRGQSSRCVLERRTIKA
jgi:hypothetical protein